MNIAKLESSSEPVRAIADDEIVRAVEAAIRKVNDPGGVAIDTATRFDALGLTSLEIVTVVFELEDRFQITIKSEYLDDFQTVGEARDVVRLLLGRA